MDELIWPLRLPPQTTCHPEVDLLLQAAQVRSKLEDADGAQALCQRIANWNGLVEMAQAHHITPVLYRYLTTTCADAVPPKILTALKIYYHHNLTYNFVLTSQLAELVECFEAHDIRVIPFKGPTLAALAYGELGLREFGDLDIFVPQQDVPEALRLMATLGYEPKRPLTPQRETAFLRSENALVLKRSTDHTVVELHWRLAPKYLGFHLSDDDLWQWRVSTSPGQLTLCTFTPEILLLFLCVHGAKHHWDTLMWVHDIAQLVDVQPAIDWPLLLAQAETMGCRRLLWLSLKLACEDLGAVVPKDIWRSVQADPHLQPLAQQIRTQWFYMTPLQPLDQLRFHLRIRERWRDRIWYGVHLATTPSVADWSAQPLPASLTLFYVVLRPIRLLRQYGTARLRYWLRRIRSAL